MKQFYNLLLQQTEDALLTLERNLPVTDYAAGAIRIIQKAIEELRVFLATYTFETIKEETGFFKHQAPEIFSQLIYFKKLYQLHTRNTPANLSMQKKQLRMEHKKIGYFYCANVELLSYYATGMQDRDEQLFTRRHQDILYSNEDYAFMIDTGICPLATYKIAKMNAYQKLENDILATLKGLKLQMPEVSLARQPPELRWTGSKIAATELVYSLFATNVMNNGQARLKEIIHAFEYCFSIELKDYQNFYQDMKMRKKSRTSFLQELRNRLEEKMDEED